MPRLFILFAVVALFATRTLGQSKHVQNDTNAEYNDSSKLLLIHPVLNGTNEEEHLVPILNISDPIPKALEIDTKLSLGGSPSEGLFHEPNIDKPPSIPKNSAKNYDTSNDSNNNSDLTAEYSSVSEVISAQNAGGKNVSWTTTSEHASPNVYLSEGRANAVPRGDGEINLGNSDEINENNVVKNETINLDFTGERKGNESVMVNEGERNSYDGENDTENRGDTSPIITDYEEVIEETEILITLKPPSEDSDNVDIAASTSPTSFENGLTAQGVTLSPSTISWLDAFLLQHRDSVWIIFNTFFMVTWIIIGIFVLYRLFGLPWCSPHISRTHYLVIHLLIFTTAAFEFVKLVHLSYGSPQGLPLFLILLLTHTPTPCLASSLILMIHCIFVSARVPICNGYLPPFVYASILTSFIILFSFVGDIIVGVTHNSAFLLVHRVTLIGICLICLTTFVVNYRKIVNVGYLMRREFRGELKSLAIPASNHDESHEAKIHLKDILILWARITLVSCIAGICMCIFSLCLSLFFTQSFVPIWAFWFLHSSIFISQVILVLTLTFGAALTLVHTTQENVVYKYFVSFLPNHSSLNNSVIKHGNFVYQRVAMPNGSSNVPRISVAPIIMENEDQDSLPINNLITELSTPPAFKSRVNLRRSATFNCAPPQNTYYGMPSPHCSTPIGLYPVLSEHLLPQANSLSPHNANQAMSSFRSNDSPFRQFNMGHSVGKPLSPEESEITCGYVSPSKRYHGYGRDRFSSLRKVPYNSRRFRPEISSPINHTCMELALQDLDIPMLPFGNAQVTPIINSRDNRNKDCGSLSLNATSPRLKAEPPEKPLRKTEPILVRSVLKDNVSLESTSLVSSTNGTAHAYAKQDINHSKNEDRRGDFYLNQHIPQYDKNITPGLSLDKSESVVGSPLNSSINEFEPVPLCNDFQSFNVAKSNDNQILFNSEPRSIIPILPNNFGNKNKKPFSSPIINFKNESCTEKSSSNKSVDCKKVPLDLSMLDNHSIQSIGSASLTSKCSQSSRSNETLNGCTDMETENGSTSTLKDSTSSLSNVESCNFNPSTLPLEKRSTLKRNNSAAGYIPSRNGTSDTNSSDDYPNQEGKQQWYGTWGGRKHKRKGANGSTDAAAGGLQFGRQLKKLPVSKGSLSSLVGRLKPKRSKSLYQTSHSKAANEFSSSVENEENDSKSLDLYVDPLDQGEDDDLFLPRVTEEMDLESEILKSSSMLANFYSLKRSDLKNKPQVDQVEKSELENGHDEWRDIEEKCKFINDSYTESSAVIT